MLVEGFNGVTRAEKANDIAQDLSTMLEHQA